MGDKSAGMCRIFTVGHSTLSLDDFIDPMKRYLISEVADVRTVPRSRHNPQFNADRLKRTLNKKGIGYSHHPGLGGLRKPVPDSPNRAWKNSSFRGFADYMQTAGFAKSLDELIRSARKKRLAIMCAEAVPWRCHRSLISDVLMLHGFEIEHIINASKTSRHSVTPWAKIIDEKLLYPIS